MNEIVYTLTGEFARDLKKLQKKKRFPSLPGDLEIARKASIDLFHRCQTNNRGIHQMQELQSEKTEVYKVTKFACRSLKSKGAQSGFRIVYAFFSESMEIVLIQIYFKGDKEVEDRKRIKAFIRDSGPRLDYWKIIGQGAQYETQTTDLPILG